MGIVELSKLTKFYGKNRGIENLDLSIKEGELFGFIGPNGAGKSTAIRLMINMLFPTSGQATIFGKDCFKQSAEIKKDIGYVPSEVSYYEHMSVNELLHYAASFYETVDPKKTDRLCERFELDRKRKIADLSLGNRKKVSVIQALIHSPRLLILDEPTSGLDPLMQNRMFEVLKEEQTQNGCTIFLSSHNLSEVERHCDRVGIIKGGAIIEVADVDKVALSTTKMVSIETASGEKKQFQFSENPNDLIKQLEDYDLVDIEIRKASLEDTFLQFYGEETEQ